MSEKQVLTIDDIKEIAASSFRIIQMSVKIDKLLFELLKKFEWSKPVHQNTDFKNKIDLLYVVLENGLKNVQKDWKNAVIGDDMFQFTPKKLKSILLDIATIRNNFAHEFIVTDIDEKISLDAFNPGIIEFFLNPSKAGNHNLFPEEIKLVFNPKLLERKNYLTINLGEHHGFLPEQVAYKFDSTQKHFLNYGELFKYFELLEQYAVDCLGFLGKVYEKPSTDLP